MGSGAGGTKVTTGHHSSQATSPLSGETSMQRAGAGKTCHQLLQQPGQSGVGRGPWRRKVPLSAGTLHQSVGPQRPQPMPMGSPCSSSPDTFHPAPLPDDMPQAFQEGNTIQTWLDRLRAANPCNMPVCVSINTYEHVHTSVNVHTGMRYLFT